MAEGLRLFAGKIYFFGAVWDLEIENLLSYRLIDTKIGMQFENKTRAPLFGLEADC